MADVGSDPEGVGPSPARLKRRSEFLAVARGIRVHVAPFTIQARRREDGMARSGARVGLTVTKKTGNAVERNRIRRRLREALKRGEALPTEPDTDYVVVARREVLSLSFGRLSTDLDAALRRAGAQLRRPRGAGKPTRRPEP